MKMLLRKKVLFVSLAMLVLWRLMAYFIVTLSSHSFITCLRLRQESSDTIKDRW